MEDQERVLLAIASRILNYPDDDFFEESKMINNCIEKDISSSVLRKVLNDGLTHLYSFTLEDLKKLYVATFDLKAKHGLYLTAHELGDSNKRGAALIKLQKIIDQAGFERIDDELADYMPMLFELLAAAPDSSELERLARRLAVAVQRILNSLPSVNPYFSILSILMSYVFPEPTKEDIEKLQFEREEADLEELPYPIMYQ